MNRRTLALMWMGLAAGIVSVPSQLAAASSQLRSGTEGGIHFIESGQARPAVLFIHGLTQSTVYWEDWVKRLGDCGVHAVAVDLPGFGGSNQAPGPYTLPGLADAVAGFIQARKLGPVTLVGGAMGSAVAQFVALNHPSLVQRLVLTATSAQPGAGGPPPSAASGAGAPPGFPANASTTEQRREMTRKRWQQNPQNRTVDDFFYAKKAPAEYAQRFYEAFRQMNLDAAVLVSEANGNWSTYERLREIKVATLIIQGAQDKTKSPEEGARMAARMPNARVVVLQEASHTPQWDQPRAFEEAALPFIMEGEPDGLKCEIQRVTSK